MSPERIILFSGAAALLLGAAFFISGVVMDYPLLKTIGSWFGIAAFIILAIPIVFFIVVLFVEKVRGK